MKNYTFFTFIVLIGSILSSCEVPDVDSSSEEEILKSHKWRRFSYLENGVEKIEDCMKDDLYEFFDDGTANVIRYNPDHLVLDTILFNGTHQEYINLVNDLLNGLVELGVENPKIIVQDTIQVSGGVLYVRPKNIGVCSEDITGYDTPILNWHFDGDQNSFTFRHDFSLKAFSDYYPSYSFFEGIESPANNIIPVDYDITFIQDTEFHVQQKLITKNPDGTLNEDIYINKYQAEPNLGEPEFSFSL